MYVGHYGAALALNSVERKASLWLLFLGVQYSIPPTGSEPRPVVYNALHFVPVSGGQPCRKVAPN